MQLTIAQFTFGLHLAGQERVVTDLAKAFKYRGHRSLVCTTQTGGELVQELDEAGVPFNCLDLRLSYDPRGLLKAVPYLKNNRVDVVITHGMSGCLVPRIAALMARTTVTMHVEHNVSSFKKKYHRLADKALFHFTDKIVCVSENARRSLHETEKIGSDKVVVIHNGLDPRRFSGSDSTPKKGTASKKRVGIIARLSEQKGHEFFLKAAAKIVLISKEIEFLIIGDGPLKSRLQQTIKENGLERYCKMLGSRPDIGSILPTLDVFVLSSLWEGLPISLLEAQYFGVASVVTGVGGNPEIVTDNFNGLVVPPGDVEAMAMAILKLVENDNMRDEFSANARKVFNERFSIEKAADFYLDRICSLMSSKNLRSAV